MKKIIKFCSRLDNFSVPFTIVNTIDDGVSQFDSSQWVYGARAVLTVGCYLESTSGGIRNSVGFGSIGSLRPSSVNRNWNVGDGEVGKARRFTSLGLCFADGTFTAASKQAGKH